MEQKLQQIKEREKELNKYEDGDKRLNLFRSWIGQADKCIRKGNLQDPYYFSLCEQWLSKCEKLLEGAPIEECKGKVKVKGQKAMPKKQRLKWKAEHKQEIRSYRKQVMKENEERQRRQNNGR